MAKQTAAKKTEAAPAPEVETETAPVMETLMPEVIGGNAVAEEPATKPERWVDGKKIAKPFMRSHFAKLVDEYCVEHGLNVSTFNEAQFQREQGLPNPVKLFRVVALETSADGAKAVADPKEVYAVDESEAIRVYKEVEHDNDKRLNGAKVKISVQVLRG